MPWSLGIIPDGNRRFARKHGIPLVKAYALGVSKAWEVLEWSLEAGIRKGVFYALSLENLRNRGPWEKRVLFSLFKRELKKTDRLRELGVNLFFAGRRDLLPRDIRELMAEAEGDRGGDFDLYVALAYSGIDEVVRAARRMREDDILKFLDVPFPLDMVLRTSGEHRLSNFLPLQSAYAELVFLDKLWPEITREDFYGALEEYAKRERRFGR